PHRGRGPVQAPEVDHTQAIAPAPARRTTEEPRPAQVAQLVRAVQDRGGPQRDAERLRPRGDLAPVETPGPLVEAREDPAEKFGNPLKMAAGLLDETAGGRSLARHHLFPAPRLATS